MLHNAHHSSSILDNKELHMVRHGINPHPRTIQSNQLSTASLKHVTIDEEE
jgi:hypothetical protein